MTTRLGASNICVVALTQITVSETFIQDHVTRLPGRVSFLHGWRPTIGSRPALPLLRRLFYACERRLLGYPPSRAIDRAYAYAFRKQRAALVLAEYGPTGVMVLGACQALGIPLVVHFHGYDASVRDVLEEHAEAYRSLFERASALVAVSHAMERKLISLGAPASKIHYIPYGIDCSKFTGGDPAGAPPLFLAVGRLVDKKGPLHTIRAFGIVHRQHPEALLRIIGTGPLWNECQNVIRELRLGDAVTMLGAQPHATVCSEMRRARCFVQHSLEAPNGDCEGTPVAVMEACATGLPVVSTTHGGIPDVIVNRETGLLVSEGDWEGMGRAMASMVADPVLAGRLGAAGRARVTERFAVESSIARLASVLESCI